MEFCITYLAGTATGVVLQITTGIPLKLLPPITAETKTAELRKLYDMVEKRHKKFVKKTLPRIPPSHIDNPEYQGMEKTTFLLEKCDEPSHPPRLDLSDVHLQQLWFTTR